MVAAGLRLFIAIGLLLCTPFGEADQPTRPPRIAVLWPGAVDSWVQAFNEGLRENGYVDHVTATIDVRATGGNVESGARMAEELIAGNPDVVLAVPGVLVKDIVNAQKRARTRTPVVFITQDPVAEGFVVNVAHPETNMTGFGGLPAAGELMTKHLQLLKEIFPRVKHVACLIDASWKDFSLQAKAALADAAPGVGVHVVPIDVRGPADLERALAEIAHKRADAMIVPLTPMSLAVRGRIIEFASKRRLPTAYGEQVFALEAGLMSYGFSVAEKYRAAAGVVARILRGAKPAEIPVDYSLRFRLVINERAAKAIGLQIPQSVLMQADEVIR